MYQSPLHLLVVDDDPLEGRLLKANLERLGKVHVDLCSSAKEALVALARAPCDGLVTDLMMAGTDGIELIRRIRETDASLPAFIITAHATLERAVDGIRAGATDFLPKPVNIDALLALIARAVTERPVREEVARRLAGREAIRVEQVIIGSHPLLDQVRGFAEHVSRIPTVRLLLTGESGTGKSALAKLVHDISGSPGRFVEVNCAAIPGSLLESELFGHEKGAFTDAGQLKRGLIELAHEGTLLLDEIGAMPLELQGKLLLFLERQEIRRVGGTQPIPITVRVIAATNDDLRQLVRERRFRLDLLYRLDVASINMPPLREMPAVVPELAARFVREVAAQQQRPEPEITDDSFVALMDYAWPGNARELRNAVERAMIFHAGGALRVPAPAGTDGGSAVNGSGVRVEFGLSLDEVERRYLDATLAQAGNRQMEEIAQSLGISRKTLWEKRRRYGL